MEDNETKIERIVKEMMRTFKMTNLRQAYIYLGDKL
jgi:hypothetical protein